MSTSTNCRFETTMSKLKPIALAFWYKSGSDFPETSFHLRGSSSEELSAQLGRPQIITTLSALLITVIIMEHLVTRLVLININAKYSWYSI